MSSRHKTKSMKEKSPPGKRVRVARGKRGGWIVSSNPKGAKQEYYQRKRTAVAKAKELAKQQDAVLKVFGASGELVELKVFENKSAGQPKGEVVVSPGFGGAAKLIAFGPGFEEDLDDFAEYV